MLTRQTSTAPSSFMSGKMPDTDNSKLSPYFCDINNNTTQNNQYIQTVAECQNYIIIGLRALFKQPLLLVHVSVCLSFCHSFSAQLWG